MVGKRLVFGTVVKYAKVLLFHDILEKTLDARDRDCYNKQFNVEFFVRILHRLGRTDNMSTPKNPSQADAFVAWYEEEKKKGLVDVKFFPANVTESTSEAFFREVNEMLTSEEVLPPEHL